MINVTYEPISSKASDNSINVQVLNSRSVCNKSDDIADHIIEHDIDVLLITETWLSKCSDRNKVTLGELVPAGYKILHVPRVKQKGGMLALCSKNLSL